MSDLRAYRPTTLPGALSLAIAVAGMTYGRLLVNGAKESADAVAPFIVDAIRASDGGDPVECMQALAGLSDALGVLNIALEGGW